MGIIIGSFMGNNFVGSGARDFKFGIREIGVSGKGKKIVGWGKIGTGAGG